MKKFLINLTILLALILLFALPTLAADNQSMNISATISSNPANGENVKIGDTITYTITLKNNDDKNYLMPMLFAYIPDGTEYISMTSSDTRMKDAGENDVNFDKDHNLVNVGALSLDAKSTITFTLKVKVLDSASEIKFAHFSSEDINNAKEEDSPAGVTLYLVFNSSALNLTEEELSEMTEEEYDELIQKEISESAEIFELFEDKETLEELQTAINGKAYINVLTNAQTHKVIKEEPAKEEPAKEEPAKEEPAKEEPAKEEPAKEELSKDETTPVVVEEKPKAMKKWGKDYNFAPVTIIALIALSFTVVNYKKNKQ